jgi:hypothetical protein
MFSQLRTSKKSLCPKGSIIFSIINVFKEKDAAPAEIAAGAVPDSF